MPTAQSPKREAKHRQGWKGWDAYADFYDWENAQTFDRRDMRFWQDMAKRANGPILELGCGTGRVTLPIARTGAHIVGVDRSAEMLAYARRRVRRAKHGNNVALVRSDIRSLPFRNRRVRSGDGARTASCSPLSVNQICVPRWRRWRA